MQRDMQGYRAIVLDLFGVYTKHQNVP